MKAQNQKQMINQMSSEDKAYGEKAKKGMEVKDKSVKYRQNYRGVNAKDLLEDDDYSYDDGYGVT